MPPERRATDLAHYLSAQRERLHHWLDRLLPSETTPPEVIHRAMRYSLFAGGKRLRPILAIATGEMFDVPESWLLPTACALEMIHTCSLIHDDLPALDNDEWRRGRPTCHKVFGEAIALLAGDALLTLAFRTLAEISIPDPYRDRHVRAIAEIARAVGTVEGMIGGQVLDLMTEGRPFDETTLAAIHRMKTGALIAAAVRVGGILGGAEPEQMQALTRYGECVGLAFQIVDDVLDVTGTAEEIGKTPGKDAVAQKATYPRLFGLDASWQKAEALIGDALDALRSLPRSERLADLARLVLERRA
jgi:geranylgeranyl diphosphate synthase type II